MTEKYMLTLYINMIFNSNIRIPDYYSHCVFDIIGIDYMANSYIDLTFTLKYSDIFCQYLKWKLINE